MAARSSSACTPGLTFGQTRSTFPSLPTRNVTRDVIPKQTRYPIRAGYRPVLVSHEGEWELMVGSKLCVSLLRIPRNAEDCHLTSLVLREHISKGAGLASAAGSLILGIEVDHSQVTQCGRERQRLPIRSSPDDVGSLCTNGQKAGAAIRSRDRCARPEHKRQSNRDKRTPASHG